MALSIKTDEADRLARELARLTGETMTQAVTTALRERLDNLRRAHGDEDVAARARSFARSVAHRYDRRPVTQAEWDDASGDLPDERAS
jgi:antitoxin VapB